MHTTQSMNRVRRWGHRHFTSAVCAAAIWAMLWPAATSAAADAVDLTYADRSIEELMAMAVTSVAGVERSLLQTPAALTVVNRDQIHAAGHLSLTEALRLVPGVYVARTDSNTWSVGTRGFNSGFGNKQLVLIDGRTTYDLLFSGTFWDVQDVLIEDIDRVEVVRGPGATLWGANAVNGVINITTRTARETQGLYASGGGGSYEKLFGQVRYGGRIGDTAWYRVWGKHFERDAFDSVDNMSGEDDWRMTRGGFRVDVEKDESLTLTVQGDAYDGRLGELVSTVHYDGRARGHNLLARASRGDATDDGWRLQAWYDRSTREISGGFEVARDTFDVDFRRYFSTGRHAAIWGAGYRSTSDQTRESSLGQTGSLRYEPDSRSAQTTTAFIQDTITLGPDRWFLMFGSKFEHNDFTGFEFQPSVRGWWTPDDRSMLWAAVSRPVRTPSRTDEDLAIVIPGLFSFTGNPDVDSEEMAAFEMGYRRRFAADLSIDIAAFRNDYRRLLRTVGPPTALTFDNSASAESTGIEIAATWQPGERWQFNGNYSYLDVSDSGSAADAPEGSAPRHMVKLLADAKVNDRLRLDAGLYWIGDVDSPQVDAYVRLDAGLNWRVKDGLMLRLRGQNVLDQGVANVAGEQNSEIPRAVFLELSVRR